MTTHPPVSSQGRNRRAPTRTRRFVFVMGPAIPDCNALGFAPDLERFDTMARARPIYIQPSPHTHPGANIRHERRRSIALQVSLTAPHHIVQEVATLQATCFSNAQ